jgi:hypothetical protein
MKSDLLTLPSTFLEPETRHENDGPLFYLFASVFGVENKITAPEKEEHIEQRCTSAAARLESAGRRVLEGPGLCNY